MKGLDKLVTHQNKYRKDIAYNYSAGHKPDLYLKLGEEFSSYAKIQQHQCLKPHRCHESRQSFYVLETKTKELEVELQRIQEQLQLNLLKQALILKHHKLMRNNSHNVNLNQWKFQNFNLTGDAISELFCKDSTIKQECEFCREGQSESSEVECQFFKISNDVTREKLSSSKNVIENVDATDEEKNLTNDFLLLNASASSILHELELKDVLCICSKVSVVPSYCLRFLKNLNSHIIHKNGYHNTNHFIKTLFFDQILDDRKLSAMHLQHQLGIQQQELIQQLQMVQRQYFIHQEINARKTQHSPALVFPTYVRTPLQSFEYRSKDNHDFDSSMLSKGNVMDVHLPESFKQDQGELLSRNADISQSEFCRNFESQETEECLPLANPSREKHKNQPLSLSPASTDTPSAYSVNDSKAESNQQIDQNMKQSFRNNTLDMRHFFPNEHIEDKCHPRNGECSPVGYLNKEHAKTEAESPAFLATNGKDENPNRDEVEISEQQCNPNSESVHDAASSGQQTSHSINLDEFINIEKFYHHLFAHGMCRWPGCDLILNDVSTFIKYIVREEIGEELQSVLECCH